jgi:hypothetical protein
MCLAIARFALCSNRRISSWRIAAAPMAARSVSLFQHYTAFHIAP